MIFQVRIPRRDNRVAERRDVISKRHDQRGSVSMMINVSFRRKVTRYLLGISLLAGVLTVPHLNAQATGSISGTVTDTSGAAMAEAAVQVKNTRNRHRPIRHQRCAGALHGSRSRYWRLRAASHEVRFSDGDPQRNNAYCWCAACRRFQFAGRPIAADCHCAGRGFPSGNSSRRRWALWSKQSRLSICP